MAQTYAQIREREAMDRMNAGAIRQESQAVSAQNQELQAGMQNEVAKNAVLQRYMQENMLGQGFDRYAAARGPSSMRDSLGVVPLDPRAIAANREAEYNAQVAAYEQIPDGEHIDAAMNGGGIQYPKGIPGQNMSNSQIAYANAMMDNPKNRAADAEYNARIDAQREQDRIKAEIMNQYSING